MALLAPQLLKCFRLWCTLIDRNWRGQEISQYHIFKYWDNRADWIEDFITTLNNRQISCNSDIIQGLENTFYKFMPIDRGAKGLKYSAKYIGTISFSIFDSEIILFSTRLKMTNSTSLNFCLKQHGTSTFLLKLPPGTGSINPDYWFWTSLKILVIDL